MSQHFLLLAVLLVFVGQISAKFIHSEDPFFGEETDETEAPEKTEETDEPKPHGWKKVYEKCMYQFDDHEKCCKVSGGGDECLLEDTTTEAGETTEPTTEEPEYSDEKFKKCKAKLKLSTEKCCFIFQDKKLKECEDWQQETTTETTEDPDKAYAKCVRRGYFVDECCRKYPTASRCATTTTTTTERPKEHGHFSTYGGTAEEFERCKSVCEVEDCCDLFNFAAELEDCGYWQNKGQGHF